MPRPPRPILTPLTIPPTNLTPPAKPTSNLPSPTHLRPTGDATTPEATDTIPLTPPPQYRPAPPARQPWYPAGHRPNANRWTKPVRGQRAVRDEARRPQTQHQTQTQTQAQRGLELEKRSQGRGARDVESQRSRGKGEKGYLGPRKSSCGRWVVVLVLCAVIVAAAFIVAHFVTSVK